MNILFISRFGDSYGLATKMAEEGNTVWYWIEDKKYQDKGKGIKDPERIKFYEPYLDRADVIIFDMSGLGKLADSLRKRGYPVIGGGEIADRMEKDRSFAIDLIKKYAPEVLLPEYKEFKSINECISFLEKEERPFVFKPDDAGTEWTLVARKDNRGLISNISRFPKKSGSFMLQEKVQGIEISTEGWLDKNGEWIEGAFNHTMETKRFMNDDWGPNTGCTGSVVWKCGRNPLVEALLIPFGDFLAKNGHVGPVDVNCIVTEEGPYFLEFTPRFGYDAIQNFHALMPDMAGFLKAVATGEGADEYELDDGYALSVRLTMAPYPLTENDTEAAKKSKGFKVIEVPEELKSVVYPVDMMMEGDEEVLAGTDNVVACVCVTGDDIEDLREKLFSDDGILDETILTEDVQARTDIGEKIEDEIEKLKNWGWLDE